GGCRFFFCKKMGGRKKLITKRMGQVGGERRGVGGGGAQTGIYAVPGDSPSKRRLFLYIDVFKKEGSKTVVFLEVCLPDQETIKKMVSSTRTIINLSPESHDPVISKLAGRGTYTMQQMEDWIEQALDLGVAGVMVWFFIGMPRQMRQSLMETVAYCER